MSRSWPRVASPSPAFSTLMTSAPNQASSCVHVGPDWTCVKSRMRTPSSALLICGSCRAGSRLLLLGDGRVEARDAAALGAGGLVDDGVDQRRLARRDRLGEALPQLVGSRRVDADAAEGIHQLVVARALDEDRRCDVAAARVDVGALVDAVVVENNDTD